MSDDVLRCRVKPLVWTHATISCLAKSLVGRYDCIIRMDGRVYCHRDDESIGACNTYEQARDICQRDYTARVMSLLDVFADASTSEPTEPAATREE